MKMKKDKTLKDKSLKDDPTWGRSRRSTKKNHGMCSRGSLKMLRQLVKQKKAADKYNGREKVRCVTRTVELPSTENIGDERNKLLFMIAVGMVPAPGRARQQLPLVMLERLDPLTEAQAATKTTERIFELFQRNQIESIRGRFVCRVEVKPAKDVEIVDLVSSGSGSDIDTSYTSDSTDSGDDQSNMESLMICNSLGISANKVQRSRPRPAPTQKDRSRTWLPPPPNCRIIPCSKARQPVFKPIVNNQDSGIFRNWKPESMTRLMNLSKSNAASSPTGSPSMLLNSLKSIPSNPSLDFRKYPSNSFKGGTCKSQLQGGREEIPPPKFLGAETVITID